MVRRYEPVKVVILILMMAIYLSSLDTLRLIRLVVAALLWYVIATP